MCALCGDNVTFDDDELCADCRQVESELAFEANEIGQFVDERNRELCNGSADELLGYAGQYDPDDDFDVPF